MTRRARPLNIEAADIRARTRALMTRHAKGCPGCARYLHLPILSYTCDTGWELAKAIAALEHAEAAFLKETEMPDPRLQTLF